MSSATLAGLVGAALVGLGLYGVIADPRPLRKILAFNLIGSGVFLVFGIVARKGAAAGLSADPVPQAMVITGIVVAFAASALAVALTLRLFEETGRATLRPDAGTKPSRRRSRRRMTEGASAIAATAGGSLLAAPILVPAAGVLLSFLLGGRQAERIALGLMPVQFGVAVAIASLIWRSGKPLVYVLGGYVPPLGIALRADGFSAVMLVTASLDHAGRRTLRPGQFRDAERSDGKAGAAGFLDSVAGDPGGLEPYLSRRRSVQPLRRARASHLRRGALWFASTAVRKRWPRRCAISCSRCSARCFICSGQRCSMGPTARSTSSFCLSAFAPSRPYGSRPG